MTTPSAETETPSPEPSIFTDAVAEVVAMTAALVANSEALFREHYDAARALGVSVDDLKSVVKAAQRVKNQAARETLDLADRRLRGVDEEEEHEDHHCGDDGGCCGGAKCASKKKKQGGCCC